MAGRPRGCHAAGDGAGSWTFAAQHLDARLIQCHEVLQMLNNVMAAWTEAGSPYQGILPRDLHTCFAQC